MKETIGWIVSIVSSLILLYVLYIGTRMLADTEEVTEKGVVSSVEHTEEGCYCLTIFPRKFKSSEYFWHLCPEETSVGDSISITVIKQ